MFRRGRRSPGVCLLAVLLAACAGAAPPPLNRVGRDDIVLPAETRTVDGRVPRDATFETLLKTHGLPVTQVVAAIDAARTVFNPRRLRAGQPFRLVLGLDGLLRRLDYEIDADRFLRLTAGSDAQIEARVLPFEQQTALVALRADIDADHPSIIEALDEAGEEVMLAVTLAEVLSGEVDFNSDLRVGDSLDVVFERRYREGRPTGYGAIAAAELRNDGRVVRAFRFEQPDGTVGYYDNEGRSLRRMFLKSPLPFAPHVSSGFSRRRLHPIHRIYRAHLGVDYRAGTGTPVLSVADGVVSFAAVDGESGRMVRVRHAGGYETYYLHLSAFGPGIRRGVRVTQGQMIGRVGMTGTANAPHLDFRIRRNGAFVNPLTVHRNMPPGDPIPAQHLEAFKTARDRTAWRFVGDVPPGGTVRLARAR